MNIPFVDLKAQYHSIKKDIDNAIADVIENTAFIKGKFVEEFEENFRELYEVKHFIGVANGTDAIYIVLKMLDIGPGDEVITVPNTWISTAETISQTGATPVFVDIDEYFTIDADKIEEKITPHTKAIIPVHLYGQPADMKKIVAIAKKHDLFLVEDAAQAVFAEFEGVRAGTIGDVATFSFFPAKNLGAYGDAGGIITNNDELAKKCRMFANHGGLVRHQHEMPGINSRLDGLQAAILNAKLPYILEWTEKRIQNADYYTELLKEVKEIETPKVRQNAKRSSHLYVIKTPRREELQAYLEKAGIATSVHYPTPLPFLPAYAHLNHSREDFPNAAADQYRILSLPMFPELTKTQIEYIVGHIKNFFG